MKIKMLLRAVIPAVLATAAMASPITYIGSFYVNGSLNGTTLSDTLVTFTVTADTTEVTDVGAVYSLIADNADDSATVTVAGMGTYSFTDTIEVMDNQSSKFAGFSDYTEGYSMALVDNTAFGSYNLKTSIGPDTGGDGSGYYVYSTSDGYLEIDSFQSGSKGTFQATQATATPEPALAIPVSMCLLGLIALRRKLRRVCVSLSMESVPCELTALELER